MAITIIGLGPGDPELLTRKAWRILSESAQVWLRTARHPGVDQLPNAAAYHSFDDWYDRAADFASLYSAIAGEVVRLGGQPGGVVYAVPGHPLVGETTVTHILAQAKAAQIAVEIVDGLSFIEPTLAALGFDGLAGVQVQDAIDVGALHHPQLNPDQPAILAQVYSLAVASDVKLTLMNQYPEDHPVTLIHGAGTPDQALERVPLYEIDRSEKVSHLTSLYVPPLARASSFERFQETIAHLRAPEGCPWDQKQTHASLRKYLLEETYEVLDAIDRDDTAALREELGDLLLQVVLHSQIAVDDGEFRMADIVESINNKIIRRHPHVWGDVKVNDSEEVKANWDALKRQEKAAHAAARADSNGGSGSADPDASSDAQSILASVPKALPALALAEKYSTRTIRVGFDWPDADAVLAKVLEEIDEVKAATTPEERAAELGDVLFSVVNWGLKFGVDAETALRETCIRFAGRFAYVERKAGYDVAKLTMDQMQAYWDEAKASGL